MSTLKDSDVCKEIMDYLKNENRPLSQKDLLNNLTTVINKQRKINALELLVSENKIKEKIYGKQKVYFVNQNVFGDSKNEDLQIMDAQVKELSNNLNTLLRKIESLETILKDLNQFLPTEMAKSELKVVKKEISELDNKLEDPESKSVHFDPNEKKTLIEEKEERARVYRFRKRLANNVIDAILEGYPKSKKQLLDDLGVETDDEDKKL